MEGAEKSVANKMFFSPVNSMIFNTGIWFFCNSGAHKMPSFPDGSRKKPR
jgi:hypothetical protein